MSSLAATQADGYYLPPEYYESGQYKHKSKNEFAGSKGHNQFLQKGLVRFELPYDGFCLHCNEHVGKGTRFNASKKENGNYYTTKIWEFRMKCRACAVSEFVIRTNPKERGFDYVSGIHKQVQDFDTKEAGTAGYVDTELGNKLVTEGENPNSALGQLESVASSRRKVMTEQDELVALIKSNSQTKFDDAASNAKVRATFRVERRGRKRRLRDGTALGWKSGMELADETVEDIAAARSMTYRHGKEVERQSFSKLRRSSIFEEGEDKKGRKSRRHARREYLSPRPDPVVSLSSNVAIKTELKVFEPQTQEMDARPTSRQRIKLISRWRSGVTIAPSKNDASPLAALADYGSDSDDS